MKKEDNKVQRPLYRCQANQLENSQRNANVHCYRHHESRVRINYKLHIDRHRLCLLLIRYYLGHLFQLFRLKLLPTALESELLRNKILHLRSTEI